MSRLILTICLFLSARAFAADCGADLAGPTADLVKASNEVGWRVLHSAIADDPRRNTLISPLSLNLALHLGLAGAAGETLGELATVLGVAPARRHLYQDALRTLTQELTTLPGGEKVLIANAAWADQSVWQFHQSFLDQTAVEAYGRALHDPATVAEINAWADHHTNGLIKQIVAEIPPDVFFMLTNALYFKAPWLSEFQKYLTKEQPFTTGEGTVVRAPLMHQPFAYVPYFEDARVQAVSLGMAASEKHEWGVEKTPSRFTLDVLLPRLGEDIVQFTNDLEAIYPRVVAGFDHSRGPVKLALPKFKIAFERELRDDLRQVGINKLFNDGEADLSPMGTGPRAHIMAVLQKVVAAMDEDGFEAAAVTSMMGGAESAMPPEPKIAMTVDRPYVFVLRDTATGLILFNGIVTNPLLED